MEYEGEVKGRGGGWCVGKNYREGAAHLRSEAVGVTEGPSQKQGCWIGKVRQWWRGRPRYRRARPSSCHWKPALLAAHALITHGHR